MNGGFQKSGFSYNRGEPNNPWLKFPAQMVGDRKVELTGTVIDRPQSEESDELKKGRLLVG